MLAFAVLALALQQSEAPAAAPPPPPAAPEVAPAPPAPRPPRAAAKAPRPEAQPAEREEPVLVGFDKKSGKRFTGDFQDTDVSDAVRQIAEAADWSVVLPSRDHGTVSARFKNAPVEDALRAVCRQAGLGAVREGAVVTFRERGGFPALPGITRDLGRDIKRVTDEAAREVEKASRAAEKELRRAERRLKSKGSEQGDKVIHGDVVVRANQPARDVVAIRGSIKVEQGAQVRDAVAVLGSIILEPGARARQAVAVGGSVRLDAGAEVEQDVVSVGGNLEKAPGAVVGGEEVSVGVPALSGLAGMLGSRMAFGQKESGAFTVAQILAKFVVFFALGLLVLALFPRRLDAVASSFTTHPWKSIFTGLLGVVVLPILIVLLVATLIGIPLVPVAALMVVAAGVLGFSALAFYIGRTLPLRTQRATSVLQLAIGTAIVVLVTAVPILGGMAWIAAALLTFGAVLRSRFGSQGGPVLPTTTVAPPPPPPAPPPPAAA
jgi:hypothetical protein